jgi:EmrB/QacA subfamily drug resistance transporter
MQVVDHHHDPAALCVSDGLREGQHEVRAQQGAITGFRRRPLTSPYASLAATGDPRGHETKGEEVASLMSDATTIPVNPGRRRWLILGVIGIAQLMVVLDLTIMNIALPSAQRALHFTTAERQWVVTAYTLSFGSLLLLGGRLADLFGRKVTFLAGLVGFAGVSAVGGASVNFAMLVTARACQGAFAALLVPSALSLLTTTFTEPKERGKAFGVFGGIAVAGGAIGLLLGGVLTQYLSWRWTLYVNLIFAAVAFAGGALLLQRQTSRAKPQLDIPGVLLVSGALFCLVYGFSNAATHSWGAPSTYGFITAGAALLVTFAAWQARAAHPLLPPRVVLDRDRSGAYLSMLFVGAGLFGTFLFLTYYLQQTLGYSPLVTGVAFLPFSAGSAIASNLATIVLMPRVGPKPLVASGMVAAAVAMAWLAQLSPHTGYTAGVLGPLILAAIGMGLVIAPSISTGTFGVAPQDAGVASATITVGQQLGASIGTSLLNTIFAAAVASYLTANAGSARIAGQPTLAGLALAHGYDAAFWWTAGIFAVGAVTGGALLRPGPLAPARGPGSAHAEVPTAQADGGLAHPG